jgi:hypothetical protein
MQSIRSIFYPCSLSATSHILRRVSCWSALHDHIHSFVCCCGVRQIPRSHRLCWRIVSIHSCKSLSNPVPCTINTVLNMCIRAVLVRNPSVIPCPWMRRQAWWFIIFSAPIWLFLFQYFVLTIHVFNIFFSIYSCIHLCSDYSCIPPLFWLSIFSFLSIPVFISVLTIHVFPLCSDYQYFLFCLFMYSSLFWLFMYSPSVLTINIFFSVYSCIHLCSDYSCFPRCSDYQYFLFCLFMYSSLF